MRQTITQTIHWLQNSHEALFTQRSVAEIITGLQTILEQFEQTGSIDKAQLSLLFAPTGPIQEIAIDNGWGAEFLLLAAEVDKITK